MNLKKLRRPDIEKRSVPQGFTLMELLVVIMIIAVLAILTMGLSRKMREKARVVTAVNSIRQVAIGTTAYNSENSGDLIRVIDPNESDLLDGTDWVASTFWGRLQPYLFPSVKFTTQAELSAEIKRGLESLLSTKNLPNMQGTAIFGSRIYADSSGIQLPFAFNNKLYQWGKFKKLSAFDNPSRIVYFTYGFYHFDKTDGNQYVPQPIQTPASQSNIYWFGDQTAAFTFLDGHVELLKPPLSDERFE